jgi:hypothetical protein
MTTEHPLEHLTSTPAVRALAGDIEQAVIDSGVGADEVHPLELAARLTAAGYARDRLAPQAREQLDRIDRARDIAADLTPATPTAPSPGPRPDTDVVETLVLRLARAEGKPEQVIRLEVGLPHQDHRTAPGTADHRPGGIARPASTSRDALAASPSLWPADLAAS